MPAVMFTIIKTFIHVVLCSQLPGSCSSSSGIKGSVELFSGWGG